MARLVQLIILSALTFPAFATAINDPDLDIDTRAPIIIETQPDYIDWLHCVSDSQKSSKEKASC